MVQTGIDHDKRPVILVREIEKEGEKIEKEDHDDTKEHVHDGEENV